MYRRLSVLVLCCAACFLWGQSSTAQQLSDSTVRVKKLSGSVDIRVDRPQKLVMLRPAFQRQDAMTTGNGTVSAEVFGNIYSDRILLSHKGFGQGAVAELRINSGCEGIYENYRRVTDMETGLVTVSWEVGGVNYVRECFATVDDIVVVRCMCSGQGKLSDSLRLSGVDSQIEYSTAVQDDFLILQGTVDPGDIAVVGRVIVSGENKEVEGNALKITGTDEVLVLLKVFKMEGPESIENVKKALGNMEDTYQTLYSDSEAAHKKLFAGARIDLRCAEQRDMSNEQLLLRACSEELPPALIERMFDYGRYLKITESCTHTSDDGQTDKLSEFLRSSFDYYESRGQNSLDEKEGDGGNVSVPEKRSGVSLAYRANRLLSEGETEKAMYYLSAIARGYAADSLRIYEGDLRTVNPVQSDPCHERRGANLGWSSAVYRMIADSATDEIRVLPALPEALSKGAVQAMKCAGGIELAMEWDLDRSMIVMIMKTSEPRMVTVQWPGELISIQSNLAGVLVRKSSKGQQFRNIILPAYENAVVAVQLRKND